MKYFRVIFLIFISLVFISQFGCNLFYVALGNIPVFFSSPENVPNKIKNPIRTDVRLSALWIGHSTILLQIEDKVIITDPFLTETVGELARRTVEPGIQIEDIPACNIILISHSHFDHLSFGSLELLEKKSRNAHLVFPKELENFLPDFNFNFIRMKNDDGYRTEFIGEEKIIDGIKVTAVYASHWGGRYGIDGYIWSDNSYTGYLIEYSGITVYFAGDTGFHPEIFKKLGEKYSIDLALIPIGPCADCENCGTKNHVFPPDAVMIFEDIKAKFMIPIHYGTLRFAQADPYEPLPVLQKIISSKEFENKIKILKIGEQIVIYQK